MHAGLHFRSVTVGVFAVLVALFFHRLSHRCSNPAELPRGVRDQDELGADEQAPPHE
jgi:hypothetical protein